ncbi:MAG: glycosyltransferase family 2 protein, partial [Planctomycetaceae bacterium]|nr:glycosyltransferase family 2 protein [Planctomycetaceae bacterium]
MESVVIFSIIVPTYNSHNFLENCLKSILSQRIDPFTYEVIIVDDCSTDMTIPLAQTYSNLFHHFHIVKLNENVGPGSARNAGIEHASGEWIVFVDSDDELSPDCLLVLKSIL